MKKLSIFIFLLIASSAFAQTSNVARLHAALEAAAVPILGVRSLACGSPNTATIDFRPEATQQQRTDGQNILLAFDCSAGAAQSFDTAQARARAADAVDNSREPEDKKLRAVLLVAIDEINNLRQWIAAFKTEVAAAASLADLKTRVADLPNMPDRTAAQAKTAIKNKINAGDVD